MKLADLEQLIAGGESETLELKRSTAELRRAGETLCAFLNGEGSQVVIGVGPDGKINGQQVTHSTLRDVAAMLGRFEPAARVEMARIDVGGGRTVIVLDAPSAREHAPFIFEGKPYRRVGSTTPVIGQDEYGRLLLDRNHSRHRWENQPAIRVRLEDLTTKRSCAPPDRHRAAAPFGRHEHGRRRHPRPTRAAHRGRDHPGGADADGTRFLTDYPQGLLKLGRFRGTKITGDILDNKQEYMHAFAWSARRWRGSTGPCRSRPASRRAASSARIGCRFQQRRCARSSSTR